MSKTDLTEHTLDSKRVLEGKLLKINVDRVRLPDGSETTRVVFWPDARRLSIIRSHSSLDARVRRQDVHGHLELDPGEPLRLRVLLDASVLEVYANDRLCLATRLYPTRAESVLGSVFVEGKSTAGVQAWEMGPMLPAERPPLKLG